MAKLKGMKVYIWEVRYQKQLSLVQLAKLSPTLFQLEAIARALEHIETLKI